jgi:multicomponent Na+:H+ antiporter subunit D
VTEPALWVILIPLAAGLFGFLLPGRAARYAVLLAALLTAAASLWLAVDVDRGGVWLYRLGGWDEPLGIVLRADGASALFIVLTGFVGLAVSIYAPAYFEERGDEPGAWLPRASFWPIWMLLWASMNALFLSNDLFNLYVCLELVTMASVALIVLQRDQMALVASLRYLLAAVLGSLAYLFGVGLLYAESGALDIGLLGAMSLDGRAIQVAGALMVVGLLLKAALFPLHFWLPAAHSSAPAPVSAILSALVIKAGFYIAVRLWFEVLGDVVTVPAEQAIGTLGALAIVLGSFQAIRQGRLKLMIAFSTVAQIGYLFLLVPLAGQWGGLDGGWRFEAWSGGLYLALSHGFAKAAMFLAAGVIMHEYGHDWIRGLSGTAARFPVVYLSFGLAGLSLIGLPPSGGFVGKWLLLRAAVESGQWWWVVVILVGGILTAGYVAIVLSQAIMHDPEVPVEPRRVPRAMTLAVFALAGVSLLLGLRAAEPLALLEIGSPLPIVVDAGP